MRFYHTFLILFYFTFNQSINAQNGNLNTIDDFVKSWPTQIKMPDGVELASDLFLPVTSDSLNIQTVVRGTNVDFTIIRKNVQYIIYDTLNQQINPNSGQLPLILIRTPYTKEGSHNVAKILSTLGYAVLVQDNRGRYSSEGVYLPLYSDGWKKDAYHPNSSHSLDVTPLSSPNNAIKHEDGKSTIEFILDSLKIPANISSAGSHTNQLINDGSISMWGGSALGYSQYQAASAMKNDISTPGLKGIMPIVATNEHYNSTLQHNGAFREALVTGWVQGQLFNNILYDPNDTALQNNIHSIFDYGNIGGLNALEVGVDEYCCNSLNGPSVMYPNSERRLDMDAKMAPINASGESDLSGSINRYKNLELPIYHLTGWWDIFLEGQIETYQQVMKHTSAVTQKNQKLVIGPWTHSLIATDSSGQLKYPNSVYDLLIGWAEVDDPNFTNYYEGEMAEWYRYILNYNSHHLIGSPDFAIPEDSIWQSSNGIQFRVPSSDYKIPYHEFINFLNGFTELSNVPMQILDSQGTIDTLINIPSPNGLNNGKRFEHDIISKTDFSNIPNIRCYITGPQDGSNLGNYWMDFNEFPADDEKEDHLLYFHQDGTMNKNMPINEPHLSYVHDPDDPVFTLGGGNLAVATPDGLQNNAGQMEYTNPNFINYTMDRPDVLHFITAPILDSLMIVGYPKAKIYMSSSPEGDSTGLTNTDFFVRVLDVYPDGKEYFVTEGAIGAIAKEYTKSRIGDCTIEDTAALFSNINGNQVYEFEFELSPMGYVFGNGHRMKVLISSSNHPKYQSNPNLPLNPGEFKRRTPNDGQNFSFNGVSMQARKATQRMFFTANYPSQISFPKYVGEPSTVKFKQKTNTQRMEVYPNPVLNELNFVLFEDKIIKRINVLDNQGRIVMGGISPSKRSININTLSTGMYFLQVATENETYHKKFIKE
jgi:predicted acyl esterase